MGWIEESNEMGTEVLPTVDNKGKQPLHPMPDEVVLPPTAEEDPKTPEGGDDEGMEEPPSNKRRNYDHYHQEDGPTHFCKLLTPDNLKIIIFDDDVIEVVNKCRKHDEAFAAKE
ncbi:hypothetical protein VPH35_000864 [Triticum aestivum]